MMDKAANSRVKIDGPDVKGVKTLLSDEAIHFLADLHDLFDGRRKALLEERKAIQKKLNKGVMPTLLPETAKVRNDASWKVAEEPEPLKKRWVEITGPTDRKMVINALNSGADIFMADFEDANSPTWKNMIEGQLNLMDAVRETITLTTNEGKVYRLNSDHATLLVRPRGWHLQESHLKIDGEEVSASLFDFALYFFHNAKELLARGKGPYFYLPKLENHKEARLWNDIFNYAQDLLGINRGTIRATVLIETILAAFEIEEILYELKDHSSGCNAGRWDYIFSVIKKFRRCKSASLPDREQITMTVPFMRSYTERLLITCHKRGAQAIGGMAAFIPSRKDSEVTRKALEKVREDKIREANDGFDGTWVAHPDLVAVAREIFAKKLKGAPHQKERRAGDALPAACELLDFTVEGGMITERGLRHNIRISLEYLSSWFRGVGAVALYHQMEDAATAEISRAQIWQWLTQRAKLNDGRIVDEKMVREWIPEEIEEIENLYGNNFDKCSFEKAQEILEKLLFSKNFVEFLTLPAYDKLDS